LGFLLKQPKSDEEHFELNKKRREYAVKHPEKVYKSVEKEIKRIKHYLKKTKQPPKEELWLFSNIIGIALRTARVLQRLDYSDPLDAGIFDPGLPDRLPKGYPDWLREEAINAVYEMLEDEENTMEWRSFKSRTQALQHELYLFSNGKQGKKQKKKRKSKRKSKKRKK